jgi:hypothetical protein
MKPTFKLTSLTLDPAEWRVDAAFVDEAVTAMVHFPFHPEYDMPFGQVMDMAEQRARDLLACAPTKEPI